MSDSSRAKAEASGPAVLDLVSHTARVRPDHPAVQAPDGQVTYGQLWYRANRLAGQLRTAGVAPGQAVGLCLDRSIDLVVAAVGITIAGAGYVALDPAQPDARLRFMVADSGASIVVAEPQDAHRLGVERCIWPSEFGRDDETSISDAQTATGASADADLSTAEAGGPPQLDNHTVPVGELAYVVYTSGSTGTPKGVAIGPPGLRNLVEWHLDAFQLTERDQTTLLASPGFDASVWEMWPSLACGATLHVPPGDLKTDPARLRDWLIAQAITVSFAPTPLAEALLELHWPGTVALRLLLTGGDLLHRRPPRGLPFALVNNYGVSEATVVTTSAVVVPGDVEDGPPGIGNPIDGVDVIVVDDDGQEVPVGAVGELLVGGVSVARGYIGDSDLNAARFVPDPRHPGGRLYRTGDLVRTGVDGHIHYAGRRDDQVQIRGLRVEVAEIETVLERDPAMRTSAVIARTVAGRTRLSAFVVPTPGAICDEAGLRRHVAEHLPASMVPEDFVILGELPYTVNGKVDRAALAKSVDGPAEHGLAQAAHSRQTEEDPGSDLRSAVAAMVAQLLGRPTVGVDENFFLLGGHSMLGAQLVTGISRQFGVEISLRYLFDHPTVAGLSEQVEAQLLLEIDELGEEAFERATARLGSQG